MENTKQQVREFYDQIGWSQVGDGLYQNARYEDLRPVSREYIHKCHLRVNRHLAPKGDILLDALGAEVALPQVPGGGGGCSGGGFEVAGGDRGIVLHAESFEEHPADEIHRLRIARVRRPAGRRPQR